MLHSGTEDLSMTRDFWTFSLYLLVGTAGTQCLATSAPFPFKTSTDLQYNVINDQSS